MSKEKLVRYAIDEKDLPPLTADQKAQIEKLQSKRDEDIDLTDIPELTEDFWKHAKRGLFFKPRKDSTTVRIDADVLAWLKAKGPGYQTRMNAILRQAMLKDDKS